MTTIVALLGILLWVAIATYADILFKSAPSLDSARFVAAAFCYASTSFLAFYMFKLRQWGWICLLWSSAALGLSLFLSVVMFHEPFSLRRRVAAACIITAILLTE